MARGRERTLLRLGAVATIIRSWQQLFEAVLARQSISVTEITRTADEHNPRVPALMGNLEENAAARKIVSLLYISSQKWQKNDHGQIPSN